MTELNIWVMFGHGRLTQLAKRLNMPINTLKKKAEKHEFMTDDIYLMMNQIECREMRSSRSVEINILKAAKLTTHESDIIMKRAYFALITWSEIYGGF